MSDDNIKPSALVISADSSVVEAIIGNNTSDQKFNARESVAEVLSNSDLLEGNGIIIFDIDSAGGGVEEAIDQSIKLKQADPTQVLIMVGEKESLSAILKSNIQPLVYRAFNKPVSPNQIFLAFKSGHALHAELAAKQAAGEDIMVVGPAENKASIESLAASRKTNPAIYAGIGVVVLAIVAFLFLGGDDVAPVTVAVNNTQPQTTGTTEDSASTVSITNELNQQAANALLDGRYIAPKGDNALEYYDQVLAIDPYDPTAYEGRKTVAESLRTSYDEQVASADFDKALETVEALRAIEPLNLANDKLTDDLSASITAHVNDIKENGSAEDIAKTTAVLDRLGNEQAGASSAAAALRAEQVLIVNIDEALEKGNLTPPAKGNAYSLVSEALTANKISKSNSESRVKSLSSGLLKLANAAFEAENTEDTSKYAALIKRLNVDREGLGKLNAKVKARQAAAAALAAETEAVVPAVEEVVPEPQKIIPAKIISREAPRYPSRALKNSTEGWVQVRFFIGTDGRPADVVVVASEPGTTFDDAATKSVKKWRFSPARNQTTGLAVRSTSISTKVQFRLD
ncbi:MAG: energy transducer TonB [Arenicella sp.]|nr:energy transducer TonB [Arenicella sp.]